MPNEATAYFIEEAARRRAEIAARPVETVDSEGIKVGPTPVHPKVEEEVECFLGEGPETRMLPLSKTIIDPFNIKSGRRLKLTAKLRQKRDDDETALRCAAQDGNDTYLRELIDKGVNFDSRSTSGGATAIISAAGNGSTDCVRTLIDVGANVHLGTVGFETALMCAAKFGHLDIIRMLLEAGADPRQCTRDNETENALSYSKRYEFTECVELIAEYWLKFQDADDEYSKKQAEAEKTAKKMHKNKVSMDAYKRDAAGLDPRLLAKQQAQAAGA